MKTDYINYLFAFVVLYFNFCFEYKVLAQGNPPFDNKTQKILFLGNSITYTGGYIADIETYFRIYYPEERYKFINAGLPSETVSGLSEPGHAEGAFPRPDLHERLPRVLELVQPDVVFACYGINDGIYMPFDEERFQKYKDGMLRLYDELKKNGVKRIIILTPPVYDDKEKGLDSYNLVLDKYTDWLLSQRDGAGWEIADIHYDMKEYILNERETNPDFKLANDGVHPGELGHWIMARKILSDLGEKRVDNIPDIDSLISLTSEAREIYKLVSERQMFMKDAWMTHTKHTRPGLPIGIPIEEAKKKYNSIEKKITNLSVKF